MSTIRVLAPDVAADASDLAPSDVVLARKLALWESAGRDGYPGDLTECVRERLIEPGRITDKGRALLARARKAGVL